ncbi:adenylyltransferase/cytidyltransferase family protein [Clostridium sp. KNHs205]|jgi:glycerol-3-phosphate cytidylyltransferase|uniref:adenylyltransferase/cytidyltransferase family protein n=1 Tax=Clostridium sp. KNHs205 TaxID=1449050 RepID=UPI00051B3636
MYHIGYIPGSFDLFHMGHLNLIKKAKERCEFLIVGICTDELIECYKGRKPYIKLEERTAIVEAIRYVDKVVKVDFTNTDKIDAWKVFHYDCHFAGSDHINHWKEERRFLEKHGVAMEFFDYTDGISTTSIRQDLGDIE